MKVEILKRTEFGNPILRREADPLTPEQIGSAKIQQLIANMKYTLETLKLGVGLAAPQVGHAVALAVIKVQPTKHRPNVKPAELVIINPKITHTYGRRTALWEGCISAGPGKAGLFAKVPRHKRVKLSYVDENGKHHNREFSGLLAHIIQHETDHLHGKLFVDLVRDTTTYMTYKEYLKLMRAEQRLKK